jgi:hypothetical protein
MRHGLWIVMGLLVLAGCKSAPERFYEGPAGAGRLVYEPGVGITRRDAVRSSDEQALYERVRAAFDERRFDDCIELSQQHQENFPEGARVVDSILLRVQARMEGGRVGEDSGFGMSVGLNQWMFLYFAPEHDERLRRLLASSPENRQFLTELRALPVQGFINRLEPDARSILRGRRGRAVAADVQVLLTYYIPALELRQYRRPITELARDLCWLYYAAGAFNRTIEIASDLMSVNPPPSVKGDALFIHAQALRRNGAHVLAADMFGYLFTGAGLRDTDTRWRPYALMWQIDQTMATSKGPGYDLTFYEEALELLGEYELYRIENPNIPPSLNDEFIKLLEFVYDVMIQRHEDAADTYRRLGRRGARDYYRERAREWAAMRDVRVAALREHP